MNSMQDKTLVCSDCGQEFTFSASEQEFFTQKGFSQPSRCRLCRAARKAARGGGSSSYGENSGGGYSSGGGGYSSGERQMYPAVCAQCGKDTQVPFQPRGDRRSIARTATVPSRAAAAAAVAAAMAAVPADVGATKTAPVSR